VEFHLSYQGPLPACNSNRDDAKSEYKQAIRIEFADQLRLHWNREWMLMNAKHRGLDVIPVVNRRAVVTELIRYNKMHFLVEMCGYRWLPIVTRANGLTCEIDVLLKRRSEPGEIFVSGDDGGDLDNRLKILLDALRMPLSPNECPGNQCGPGERDGQWIERVVVLEDDSLISKVTIEARQLNTEPKSGQGSDWAEVDIKATLKTLHPTPLNQGYAG
jgi:hypothetical protein